jgi:hypothetical protein
MKKYPVTFYGGWEVKYLEDYRAVNMVSLLPYSHLTGQTH